MNAPRASASSSARDQLLGGLLHPVGVVLAEVGVGVEQLESGNLLEHDLGPGPEQFEQVHRPGFVP